MYLKLLALCKIFQTRDTVHTQGDYFQVRHLLDKGQILQVISPKIEVFNVMKRV